MATWNNSVKTALLKGIEAIGHKASNLASNAHQKLDELNLETRRRELLHEVPVKAMDLWQSGVKLPDELEALLAELHNLDQHLTVMRAQRYAKVEEDESATQEPEQENVPEDVNPQPEGEKGESGDDGETGDNA